MAMERALNLARRQHRQVVSQLLCADMIADGAPLGGVDAVVLDVVELDVVDVHDGLRHVFPRALSAISTRIYRHLIQSRSTA